MKKNVLCFGDSNTWGFIPGTAANRFEIDRRWAGILQANLADTVHVIEEGQNGRTTAFPDPCMVNRNGADHIGVMLDSHAPLDLVVVMLGTNDLKHYFGFNAHDIACGAACLVEKVLVSGSGSFADEPWSVPPRVLLVTPPAVVPSRNSFGHKFDGAVEVSQGLAEAYREVAKELGVPNVNAGDVVTVPDTDGIHMDAGNHQALGEMLTGVVRELLELS